MTRKDTIMIAVIINACLLAILFITAVVYEEEQGVPSTEPKIEAKGSPETLPTSSQIVSTGDEVDNVLKYYHHPSPQPIVVETPSEVYLPEPLTPHYSTVDDEDEGHQQSTKGYTEVVVKKGDALEKIAKTHKTTVKAIKNANHLENEKLSIGQVLKIPQQTDQKDPVPLPSAPKSEETSSSAIYHVVKSGDSPWKIAKEYNVNYAEILRLNNLDEDKAKNLKIGERIRVK